MNPKEREMRKAIDDFIGSGGHPGAVLMGLADAAAETASHVDTNWGDKPIARVWRKLSDEMSQKADKLFKSFKSIGY